jgi:hypothetical protein
MADKPLSGPHRTGRRIRDNTNEIDVTSFDMLPMAITSEGFGLGEHFRNGEVTLFHSSNFPK